MICFVILSNYVTNIHFAIDLLRLFGRDCE